MINKTSMNPYAHKEIFMSSPWAARDCEPDGLARLNDY